MKYLKIVQTPPPHPPPLPFLTVIALHRVKKSQLIIGIVDRIKINKEQLFPFSDSELSHTFCKLQVLFTSVWFISRRSLRYG